MRFAVLLLALGGCDLVFGLDVVDVVPHIPDQQPGEGVLAVPPMMRFTFDTTRAEPTEGDFTQTEHKLVRHDNLDTDVAVIVVGDVTIEGTLAVTGSLPLIIVANTITVSGTIDASALLGKPGPGGGEPDRDDPGQGGAGDDDGRFDGSRTGGGGGGFASGAGTGGRVDCDSPLDAALGGPEIGAPALVVLQGGGAGGRGRTRCTTSMVNGGGGGGGGGAIQLSARVGIVIDEGRILAGGGGGLGGIGETACTPPGDGDGGGGGGGAGGAIYLDAPTITNTNGTIAANGGGGGGGGRGLEDIRPLTPGSGLDGNPGKNAIDADMPGVGGASTEKGTSGGNGAIDGNAANGEIGTCRTNEPRSRNTGGGGGAAGRIVFRTNVKIDPIGNVSPLPTELTNRGEQVP